MGVGMRERVETEEKSWRKKYFGTSLKFIHGHPVLVEICKQVESRV